MTTPINPNRAAILAVLSFNTDYGKTAREVAEAAGLKYSTVTGLLRELAEDGHAQSEKSGRQVAWTRVAVHPLPGEDNPTAADLDQVAVFSVDGPIVTDETTTPVANPANTALSAFFNSPAPSETAVTETDDDALHAQTCQVPMCPRCFPVDPSQTVSAASDGGTHPDAPAEDGWTASDVLAGPDAPVVPLTSAQTAGDVLGFMSSVRPVPDAPAAPERATRTRSASAAPARDVRNDFGSGGLQGEILRLLDADDAARTTEFGPNELAAKLAAHASSVAYSLKRTTAKGQTVQTSVRPPRFRLATSAEASAHARAVADAKAVETATQTPAA